MVAPLIEDDFMFTCHVSDILLSVIHAVLSRGDPTERAWLVLMLLIITLFTQENRVEFFL